jgi:hypothetical protein
VEAPAHPGQEDLPHPVAARPVGAQPRAEAVARVRAVAPVRLQEAVPDREAAEDQEQVRGLAAGQVLDLVPDQERVTQTSLRRRPLFPQARTW